MKQPRRQPGRRPGLLAVVLLALLSALVGPLLTDSPARAADPVATGSTALSVHLARLSPAAIGTKGTLVLAGTVTNDSEDTWNAVNVHPFLSRSPMTTRDQLAAAAASDPETEVGTRLVEQNEFVAIGNLVPGQTAGFRIALKVKSLIGTAITGEQGVYWIGVHALGQNAQGGARETLGRARTFIPLVRSNEQTSVSVVVPVRERVRRDADGRVFGTTSWSSSLAPTGRLGRLASFIASAGTHPATLLIDPAVVDAVSDLKDDNKPLSFGKAEDEDPDDEPTSTPSGTTSRSSNRLEPIDRANAETWLSRIVTAAQTHTTLGLGYADPDANSLARRRPTLLKLADKLAAQTFTALDIPAVPALAPPGGWFDDDLLAAVPKESMILVEDHAAPRTRTRWRTTEQQDLVFSDSQVADGGPGPTSPTDALAYRQRILADAALRLPERSTSPLVVQLPNDWDPGTGWELADFFNSFDQPWLNLVPLAPTTDSTTPTFTATLGYPRSVRRAEVPLDNITVARTLTQTTTVLSSLLQSENTIAHDLAGAALSAVSNHARKEELLARQQVLATNTRMRNRLAKVEVIGTEFVTLSGGSGTLAVTLVNGLDQPIEVGVEPQTSDPDVRIDSTKPVRMAPGERTVLRLDAKSSNIGVTEVVLSPVTEDGTELGTPLSFRLRTSQVGMLIWGVLGAGGLLLVVMIARRIRKGLREHRWRRA
ncbi:DUF6049 family protein [Marmoricola sp. OAE513]|uniref:DUF6049 family protein n=1 Tax=Marmoricola sp. OAE513 TaxID=2817894 RepID=UPI001AE82E53